LVCATSLTIVQPLILLLDGGVNPPRFYYTQGQIADDVRVYGGAPSDTSGSDLVPSSISQHAASAPSNEEFASRTSHVPDCKFTLLFIV
jgi:hypothetical protein